MTMTKRAILTVLAIAAAAMATGCGPSILSTADAGATAPAGQQQNKPQMVTPYSQPLMATGGDLVMLPVRTPPGIADQTSGC
jgi:hypothetical protein